MSMPSSQQDRRQAGKEATSAGCFFDQYVTDDGFAELDPSVNDCAAELLDSMEADRIMGSLGANKDLDLEALPFMNWESQSTAMEGACESEWSTSQNSTFASASPMSFDGLFQHGQFPDVATNEDQLFSNDSGLNPSTFPQSYNVSPTQKPVHQESQQDSDMDSFAVLNAAFKDLVQAKAAADSRCLSQKTKQRDASIALHLQRLRAACDQTEQLLENSTEEPETGDSMISACGDEIAVFPSPMPNHNLKNPIASSSSSGGYSSSRNSPPESSWSGPSQRSPPELSTCSDSFSQPSTQFPRTAQTPSGSQEIHQNGAMEIVLDLNMNPCKSLPRKQRKRSQAQRERYQNVRKHGACLKHKKLKKLCTCFDNIVPQDDVCRKVGTNSQKLAKARNNIGSVRACQPTKSLQLYNKETSIPVSSALPVPSTTPGHDRLLSKGRVHNGLEALSLPIPPDPTSCPFVCLIPGCTYCGVDASALESHYGSVHAHELSYSPVALFSNSSVSQRSTTPVTSPITRRRSEHDRHDAVQSIARTRQELDSAGTSRMDPTEAISQLQPTRQVRGTGRIDPDIDCPVTGSCEVHAKDVRCSQPHNQTGRTDVRTYLLYQILGLLSVPTIWLIGLFWSVFAKYSHGLFQNNGQLVTVGTTLPYLAGYSEMRSLTFPRWESLHRYQTPVHVFQSWI